MRLNESLDCLIRGAETGSFWHQPEQLRTSAGRRSEPRVEMAIGGSGNEGLISLQEVQEDGLGLVGKGHRQTGGSRSRDGNTRGCRQPRLAIVHPRWDLHRPAPARLLSAVGSRGHRMSRGSDARLQHVGTAVKPSKAIHEMPFRRSASSRFRLVAQPRSRDGT